MYAAFLSTGIILVCSSGMIALRVDVSEQVRNGLKSAQTGRLLTYIANIFHLTHVTITY